MTPRLFNQYHADLAFYYNKLGQITVIAVPAGQYYKILSADADYIGMDLDNEDGYYILLDPDLERLKETLIFSGLAVKIQRAHKVRQHVILTPEQYQIVSDYLTSEPTEEDCF